MANLPPWKDPAIRRLSIGSSDVGVLLGENPFKSAVVLYLEKRGEIPPQPESEQMWWGTDLEANVCARYQEITGNKVARVNKTQRLERYPFVTSHIDRRLIGQSKILEAKCVGLYSGKGFGDAGSDDLPFYIIAQVQWQMGVNSMDAADVAALFGAQWTMRIFPVIRDRELFAKMLDAAVAFWARVQEGRPPEPESEMDCKALWPSAKRSVVVVNGTIGHKCQAYHYHKTLMQEAKLAVQKAAGDHEILEWKEEILATYKNTSSTRFDGKTFKADHPELHKKYLKTTTGRRLLIKERKDNG